MKFDHSNDWFYKYNTDEFTVEWDFTKDLATGDAVASALVTIKDSLGVDRTASMISDTAVSSPNVTFKVDEGSAGETYLIKLIGYTTGSSIFTHKITCEIFGDLVLNAKLGDSSQNSYVTLKEANDYIRNVYGHSNLWDTLTEEGKKRILIQAAQDLEVFNYNDAKYYDSQALQFPRDNHDVVTGNCATPLTINSFKSTSLYSTTYGTYPTDYWKYGTCHITSATPVNDIRIIDSSNSSTGVITMQADFTATPVTTAKFLIFYPLPNEIKNAQCEQAVYLVQNRRVDSIQAYKDLGVERVDIGDTRILFGRTNTSTGITVSSRAKKLLGRWLRRAFYVGRG